MAKPIMKNLHQLEGRKPPENPPTPGPRGTRMHVAPHSRAVRGVERLTTAKGTKRDDLLRRGYVVKK